MKTSINKIKLIDTNLTQVGKCIETIVDTFIAD